MLGAIAGYVYEIEYDIQMANDGIHHKIDLLFNSSPAGEPLHRDPAERRRHLRPLRNRLQLGAKYTFTLLSQGHLVGDPLVVDRLSAQHRDCIYFAPVQGPSLQLRAARETPNQPWSGVLCEFDYPPATLLPGPPAGPAPAPRGYRPGATNLHYTIPASHWCISSAQLANLLQMVNTRYTVSDPSAYDVVRDIIRPQTETQAAGVSYALHLNPDGMRASTFVSHAWAAGFKHSCENIIAENLADGIWLCYCANPQFWDNEDLDSLLGANPFHSPFAIALNHAPQVIVMRNDRLNLYSRLWCVFELFLANEWGMNLRYLGDLPSQDPRTIRNGVGSSAECSKDSDTNILQGAIRGREPEVDAIVLRAMQP